MNTTLFKTSTRIAATIALACLAGAALAQTTKVNVDAVANCADLGGAGAVAPVYTDLVAGTYAIKVRSSTATYCANGGCAHPTVAITIDDGVNYHTDTFEISATKATNVTFGGAAHVWAYFIDTQCSDNAGKSVLQFTQH